MLPLLLLSLYPLLRGIYLAFTSYDLYVRDASLIGLANFIQLATADTLFWGSLTNNVLWTVGIVVITYGIGLFTAIALNEKLPGRIIFRGITLIPWVCPAVVAGLTWRWIYDPNFGLLNYLFMSLGLIDRNIGWLSGRNTALIATMIVAVWKMLPFSIVMLLAGLQAVPEELYEAASIDGAGVWGRFRYITVPLLNRVGKIAILLSTISAFNHFDSIYVLTGGGPGNRTMLLSIMAYQNAFRYFKVGYASAIGVIMLLMLLLPIVLYTRQVTQDIE
jgi:multiple sugar transport system permease protein